MMSNRDSTNVKNFAFNQSMNMTMTPQRVSTLMSHQMREEDGLPAFTPPYCESKLDIKEPPADMNDNQIAMDRNGDMGSKDN